MSQNTGRKLVCAAMIGAASLISGDEARAQEGPNGDASDEIVVTAQRREQNLQDVPLAVTAVGGEELAARNVVDVRDLGQFTPSLTVQGASRSSGGGANAAMFVRGVGQDEFLISFDPGVGIYLDEVYLGRTVGAILDMADVERVEVLRGPQGTLFGRNTIGGALQIVSKAPELEDLGGFVTLGARSDDGYEATGALNVPLGQSAALRLTAQTRVQDGFATNQSTGADLSNVDRQLFRAQLLVEPTERLRISLSADGSSLDERGIQASLIDVDPSNAFLGLYNGLRSPDPLHPVLSVEDVSRDGDVSNLNRDGLNQNEAWGFGANISYRMSDQLLFKSITSYRELSATFTADLDGTDEPFVDNLYDTEQDQFSQELQIQGESFGDRLEFVVGGFYFRERAREAGAIDIFAGLFDTLQALPGPGVPAFQGVDCGVTPEFCAGGAGNPNNAFFDLQFRTDSAVETDSLAVFAQFDYHLTDALSVTLGLRQSWDDKTLDYVVTRGGGSAALCAGPFAAAIGCIDGQTYAVAPTRFEDTFEAFTPRFGINYRVNDDVLLYASAARGFKSGGFNGRATTPADLTIFNPEEIWSYELGAKSTWLDQRLTLNAALFYSDYQDLQFAIAVPNPLGPGTLSPVINAGAAEIMGLEIESRFAWTPELSTSFGGSWIEAEYSEDVSFLGQPTGIVAGNRLPKTPNLQVFASIDLDRPVFDGRLRLLGRLDASYRSDSDNEPSNYAPVAQDAYSLFNARVGISNASNAWALSLWGRNLTDERYLENAFRSGGGTNVGYFARGREIGLSATVRY